MQLLLNTIVLSSLYALLGAGFIITYKSSRVLNFAFADWALLAGYATVALAAYFKGTFFTPALVVLLFFFLLGLGIYRIFIRPMVGESILASIMLTLAFGVIINAVTVLLWKNEIATIRFWGTGSYQWSDAVFLSKMDLLTAGSVFFLFLGLAVFYRYTKIGRQMRATAENILLSSQRGMNIYFITGVTWGIGIFTIAIAGILFGANYGVSMNIHNTALIGISVAMVGGLDSLIGTIPAAFIIALSQKLAVFYINPRLSDTVPYIFIMIILIIKPWGLFGTEEEVERV